MATLVKNPKVQQVVKVATVAGAAILVVGAVVQLTKTKQLKDVLFPALSILVGIAAFSYATAKPKTNEPTSNALGYTPSQKVQDEKAKCRGYWCNSAKKCVGNVMEC